MRSIVRGSIALAAIVCTGLLAESARGDDGPGPPPPPAPTPRIAVSSTVAVSEAPQGGSTSTDKDTPTESEKLKNPDNDTFLHGFRLGMGYVMNIEHRSQTLGGQSLQDATGMKSPAMFLIGYEAVYRAVSHSWLNVILVANATIGGLEQSKFFPTANGLIGFEFHNSFQLGVGPSLSPLKGEEAHVIVAAGWTPRVGTFYVPVHAYFIPDVDGYNRMGLTTGVTW